MSGWSKRSLRGDPDRLRVMIEGLHQLRMDRRRVDGLVAAHSEPKRVQRWYHKQRQCGRNEQATHDGDGHRTPENAAGEWDHAQDGSEGSENDGTRTPHGRADDRAMAP